MLAEAVALDAAPRRARVRILRAAGGARVVHPLAEAGTAGRHFPPLIPWFVVQLAHKVHQALQGGAERLRDAQAESGEYPVDRTYVS